jgi:hypothetical protein
MRNDTVFVTHGAGVQEYDALAKESIRSHLADSAKCLLRQPSASKDLKLRKISDWSQHMDYQALFNLNYSYRIRTEAVFNNDQVHIFDFFVVDDMKFEQFYLYQNLWRETLLLNFLRDDARVANLVDFGQLPNRVVYREIKEQAGITLDEYIQGYMAEGVPGAMPSKLNDASGRNSWGAGAGVEASPPGYSSGTGGRKTVFTEYDTIKIGLHIIDLLEVLHSKKIVHTNLTPSTIFLRGRDISRMCFTSLYHCCWQTKETLKNFNIDDEYEDNISLFDTRTRDVEFISPEQINLGSELAEIVYQRNGRIDETQHEVQDFINSNFAQKSSKINLKSDIYSLGAILFKLLTG